MNRTILIRYGELALKGNNREYFEKKLVDNIKKAMKTIGNIHIIVARERGRIILKISYDQAYDERQNQIKEQIIKLLSMISGISSFSFAYECDYNIEDNDVGEDNVGENNAGEDNVGENNAGEDNVEKDNTDENDMEDNADDNTDNEKLFKNLTNCFDENLLSIIKEKISDAEKSKKQLRFRATATRLVKTGINSHELQQKLGSHVWTATEGKLKVDLKNFDFQIEAEILKKAYIFSSYDHYIGKAGLPLGTQGTALALFFSDKIECCARAATELMRRGTIPILITSPITSQDSKKSEFKKALENIKANAPGFDIKTIPTEKNILEFANEFAETRDIRAISVPDTIEN